MVAKVKAGGIIRNERLAKIGIMSAPDRCGLACDVLRALGDKDINVEFIVQCIDLQDNSHIVFCVREDDFDATLAALAPMKATVRAEDIIHQCNIALVSVFGPDLCPFLGPISASDQLLERKSLRLWRPQGLISWPSAPLSPQSHASSMEIGCTMLW